MIVGSNYALAPTQAAIFNQMKKSGVVMTSKDAHRIIELLDQGYKDVIRRIVTEMPDVTSADILQAMAACAEKTDPDASVSMSATAAD
jgi:hypothetical protein